jgi:hypothetical protein
MSPLDFLEHLFNRLALEVASDVIADVIIALPAVVPRAGSVLVEEDLGFAMNAAPNPGLKFPLTASGIIHQEITLSPFR